MYIDYNMSRDYCSDWTAIDAIREIVQNAIDSKNSYECTSSKTAITVTTNNVVLPPEVFTLGISQKTDNAIGKYGEGFKIAMLVLTRLGHKPVIISGTKKITGVFKEHEFTGVETFCLQIEEEGEEATGNLMFVCFTEGLDLEELRTKITPFSNNKLSLPETVNILQNQPGMVFVNGLFVTENKDLTFGYNFAPNQIELNRDRNMTNNLDWTLAKYYDSLGPKNAELIFNLIERDAWDVKDLAYRLHNAELKAELARLFYKKYGEGSTISKPGTVYVGSTLGISCSSSASRIYSRCGIKETKKVEDPDAPDQVLNAWLQQNRNKLRRDVRNSMESVINRSKGWRKADIL